MARNEEKQQGKLNRLWLQKEREGERQSSDTSWWTHVLLRGQLASAVSRTSANPLFPPPPLQRDDSEMPTSADRSWWEKFFTLNCWLFISVHFHLQQLVSAKPCPPQASLHSASSVTKWIPSIKKEIEYYLQVRGPSAGGRVSSWHACGWRWLTAAALPVSGLPAVPAVPLPGEEDSRVPAAHRGSGERVQKIHLQTASARPFVQTQALDSSRVLQEESRDTGLPGNRSVCYRSWLTAHILQIYCWGIIWCSQLSTQSVCLTPLE